MSDVAHCGHTVGKQLAKAEIAMNQVAAPAMVCQVVSATVQAFGGGGTQDDVRIASVA